MNNSLQIPLSIDATQAINEIGCKQGTIVCHVVDDAVWEVVSSAIQKPDILLDALDQNFNTEKNVQLAEQIEYIEEELKDLDKEDELQYRLVKKGFWTEEKYGVHCQAATAQRATLKEQLANLKRQVMTEEQLDNLRRLVLAMAEHARTSGQIANAPVEVRRRIIKMVVDRIVLNTQERWIRIEGAHSGQWAIDDLVTTHENIHNLPAPVQ